MISASDIFKASILIADDKRTNITLLEQMLRGAGYHTVSSTDDARTVCGLHRKHRYDLILLDLQMPGMDGFEVMAGLKEIESGSYLPVLVTTAQPELKLRALHAGAKDFLSQPFDLAEVLLRVYNMLEVRLLYRNESRSSARLENSQRIAGLGDWEYDFASRRLVWSEGIYRILGLSPLDSGPDAENFDRQVHPEDRALVDQAKKIATEGLHCAEFENRIIRPDGEVRYIQQITELIVDEQGQPIREAGTLQDITERKLAEGVVRQSEQRFKFVARAVSDGVWDWDLAGNTLWRDGGFMSALGFETTELESSVEFWNSRIHPEERTRVSDSIQQALEGGAESWSAEYRFQRKDGTYATVQDCGYIVRDEAGKGIRMVGGVRDLTEQKKLESQNLRTQRMDTLAGSIAHDLNSVLAPIMMSIELLKLEPGKDARSIKILDIVETSCRRGADLVRQVVSFAHGLDGPRVGLKVRDLIGELEKSVRRTFPPHIRLITKVATEVWPIRGDAPQLTQLLLSLAEKARDGMPQGGTLKLTATNLSIDRLYAGTSADAKAGPYVLVQMTDDGPGMATKARERTNSPFFTTQGLGRQTGVGLATAHSVVKSHGGFLLVESGPARGTTLKIHLPADPSLQDAKEPVPVDLPRGHDELVLVADDEFGIRDITRQTLEAFGYRVLTACDGADAVALYAAHPSQIAVVLLELAMPVMDGAATIQVLTRLNPAIRIIATSGIKPTDHADKANGHGVYDVLPKPYSAKTLLSLLRDVVNRPIPALAR